jgi:hypothetical protein
MIKTRIRKLGTSPLISVLRQLTDGFLCVPSCLLRVLRAMDFLTKLCKHLLRHFRFVIPLISIIV